MSDSPYISDVTAQTFMAEVMERSVETPVLVDFWADWCNPCKSLMPILAKLADEYQGSFYLAKVDTDQEQMLAQQAGIRSLPTVMLFVGGQPVDQFMGALPEGEIRSFLARHNIESAAGVADDTDPVTMAKTQMEAGQLDAAAETLRQAQAEDPSNPDILLTMGEVALARSDLETAETVLKILPEDAQQRPEALRIKGVMKFAQADNAEYTLASLQQTVAEGTPSSEERYQLGVKHAVRFDYDQAAEAFFGLMMRDRDYGEDGAKNALLAICDLLAEDPRATKIRRRIFSMMH